MRTTEIKRKQNILPSNKDLYIKIYIIYSTYLFIYIFQIFIFHYTYRNTRAAPPQRCDTLLRKSYFSLVYNIIIQSLTTVT